MFIFVKCNFAKRNYLIRKFCKILVCTALIMCHNRLETLLCREQSLINRAYAARGVLRGCIFNYLFAVSLNENLVFGEAVFIGLFVWSAELLSEEAVFIGLFGWSSELFLKSVAGISTAVFL